MRAHYFAAAEMATDRRVGMIRRGGAGLAGSQNIRIFRISGGAMREFSTVELLRDLKTVTHAAARAPVAITQHRKARFVLMAVEDYERLKADSADPRRAYRTDETPADLAALLVAGLDRIIDGESGASGD